MIGNVLSSEHYGGYDAGLAITLMIICPGNIINRYVPFRDNAVNKYVGFR